MPSVDSTAQYGPRTLPVVFVFDFDHDCVQCPRMRSHDQTRLLAQSKRQATTVLQHSPMYKAIKQGTKRKSRGALLDARSAKQPKLTIDSFFSRKVSIRIGSGLDGVAAGAEEKVLDVVLSDEQVKVLNMVVEEGKNVFFTGSAGTPSRLSFSLSLFHVKRSGLIVMPLPR
jgi:hypothetical protein